VRRPAALRPRVRARAPLVVALAACVAALLAVLAPARARAHHVPGHGASEGIRNLNSLGGGTGKAINRVALLQEVARTTTSLTPGTVYNTSLLGEYSPHPWTSFGAQLPLLVIDEDASGVPTKVGYGDTRLFVRLTPHADKLVHRVLTTVLNVSLPTRTVTFTSDPGRTVVVAPALIYSRTHPRAFWQLLALGSYEHRPAGTAIDLSAGGQVGARLFETKLSPALGLLADVRTLTFCAEVGGGARFCPEGRTTELARPIGALRVTSLAAVTYAFAPWGLVSANVQLPLLTKRDFDIAGSLTFQAMF
jgi:hypothetical protein